MLCGFVDHVGFGIFEFLAGLGPLFAIIGEIFVLNPTIWLLEGFLGCGIV